MQEDWLHCSTASSSPFLLSVVSPVSAVLTSSLLFYHLDLFMPRSVPSHIPRQPFRRSNAAPSSCRYRLSASPPSHRFFAYPSPQIALLFHRLVPVSLPFHRLLPVSLPFYRPQRPAACPLLASPSPRACGARRGTAIRGQIRRTGRVEMAASSADATENV